MKKILILLCVVGVSFISQAQVLGIGNSKKLDEHNSEPGYFWFRPVIDVDTATLDKDNANTLFLVEAHLQDGKAIQIFIEGRTLKFLLRLPIKQAVQNNPSFEGYMYTVKSLGENSVLTKKKIKKGRYYEKQKERLLREKNTKKYELWSESPTKVKGYLSEGTTFLPSKGIISY